MTNSLLQQFTDRVRVQFANSPEPTANALREIGKELRRICQTHPLDTSQYPMAGLGQELLYPLAVDGAGGPSLYLVSDAPGVMSPPHEHQTWAVIVGLSGVETNTLFAHSAHVHRGLAKVSDVVVGTGDIFCMRASDVHATCVEGAQSSYHLHVYGRPLSRLASFASRCYELPPS